MPISGYDQRDCFSGAYVYANTVKEAFAEAEIATPFHCVPFGCKDSNAECAKKELAEIMTADMLILADGWEESPICRAALAVAEACKIDHYTLQEICKKHE